MAAVCVRLHARSKPPRASPLAAIIDDVRGPSAARPPL
jgi:hypothetical protein